MLTWWDLT